MNCKRVQANLSAYLDREIASEEAFEIRAHLVDCAHCAREEHDLRALKALLGGLKVPEPSPGFEERLASVVCRPATEPKLPRASAAVFFVAIAAVSMGITFYLLGVPKSVDAREESRNQGISFEVHRDQAFQAGGDPYGGSEVLAPVDYER